MNHGEGDEDWHFLPGFKNLHVFIHFFRAIIGHDVNTLEALDDFAVGMIQGCAHHVAADSDFNFAFGILEENGAVEGDHDTGGIQSFLRLNGI